MKKPCEYCGCDLPLGVDKNTRRIRSRHFSSCKARPSLEVESPALVPLTDEQIDALRNQHKPSAGIDFDVRCREFARAIEAAHGITKGQP
jgi:hypothetical protein